MSQWKYVVIEAETRGVKHQLAVIFPDLIWHSDAFNNFRFSLTKQSWTNVIAISAGFCQIHNEGISCYGESESLNLKSRLEVDEELIEKFYLTGGKV